MTIAVITLGGVLVLLVGIALGFTWAMNGTKTIVARMTPEELTGFRAASNRGRFEGGK